MPKVDSFTLKNESESGSANIIVRFALPFVLCFIHACALLLLLTVGETLQAVHLNPQLSREIAANNLLGKRAPAELLRSFTSLPATAIIYPRCSKCSVESPVLLKGQVLDKEVTVIVPGASEREINDLGSLGPRITCRASSQALADAFGVPAAPRVVKVFVGGIVVYIQPSYVPGIRLHEVINGE